MKGFSKLTLLNGMEVVPTKDSKFSVQHAQDRTVMGFTDGVIFVPATAVAVATIIPS